MLIRPRAIRALLAVAVTMLLAAPAAAQQQQQTGRIVGRILDANTGVGLADVGVQVVGTTIGAMSGVDGRYALNGVPAGTVTLHVRRIGYQPKTVTGILLEPGATLEQSVSLSEATVTLTATVVTAHAEKGSVSKALDEQRTAAAIVNSTTSEQIARSPDGNAAQAVQRVAGVTVQDGKYVFVRGLGERYTTTSLNGARLPSPEPERKVVPLDLFPASLIEAITTSKTFTPDQPGDFSGASVNIRTREFPAERTMSVSTSVGWNSAATGRSMLQPPVLGAEWLGFASDDRRLPSTLAGAGNLLGVAPGAETNALLRSFRNSWSPRSGSGSPNSSFGLTLGGEDPIFGHRVGYVASTSYSYAHSVNASEALVIPKADGRGGATPLSSYTGEAGRASVLWGGMLNLSTWIGAKTRLSLDNSYSRGLDSEARIRTGTDEQYDRELRKTRLSLVERSVLSSQLRAEHALGGSHTVDWTLSRSEVERAEPDRADLVYWREGDRFVWKGAANDATRSFADLRERDLSAALNYKLAFGAAGTSSFKTGAYARQVRRGSDLRAYDILNQRLDTDDLALAPEELFRRFAAGADTNLLLANSTFGGRYDASEDVAAGYAMVDVSLPMLSRLRVIAGARVEHSDLRVRSFDPQGRDTTNGPRTTDVLPSLSLGWSLTENQALRASATQTLSRPEYRELSPIAYADVGGDNVERGNPGLDRALIRNYDVRWEWYPNPSEVVSVGVFAKTFVDPIERVYQATTGFPTIGFTNADGARNYGVEVDVRKGLGALGRLGEPFTAFANATLMRSRIEIGDSLTAATNPNRAMVGQAPYVVNAGLTYASPEGGTSATLLYNVVGERITLAGVDPLPDTREQPRHMLDLSLRVALFGGVGAKIDAKNLLDAPYEERTGDLVRRRFTTGRALSVGLSWRP